MFRKHKFKFHHNLQQHVSQNLGNEHAKFICTVSHCLKQHHRYDSLIEDLKEHLRRKECVECPASRCTKMYRYLTSSTSHMSRYHSKELCIGITMLQKAKNDAEINTSMENEHSDNIELGSTSEISNEFEKRDITSEYKSEALGEMLLFNMAQMFIKLEAEFLVPVSTIQYIVTEMENIADLRMDVILSTLRNELSALETSNLFKIEKVIEAVLKEDPISTCNAKLKTDFLRKKLYKDRLAYVSPRSVSLGMIYGKKGTFITFQS